MIQEDRLVTGSSLREDDSLDRAVRPKLLADYVGQPVVRDQMQIFIEAARRREEALDHLLIFGPPGLGKTTLAHIAAAHCGYRPLEINARYACARCTALPWGTLRMFVVCSRSRQYVEMKNGQCQCN